MTENIIEHPAVAAKRQADAKAETEKRQAEYAAYLEQEKKERREHRKYLKETKPQREAQKLYWERFHAARAQLSQAINAATEMVEQMAGAKAVAHLPRVYDEGNEDYNSPEYAEKQKQWDMERNAGRKAHDEFHFAVHAALIPVAQDLAAKFTGYGSWDAFSAAYDAPCNDDGDGEADTEAMEA